MTEPAFRMETGPLPVANVGGEMAAKKMKAVFDARHYLGLTNAYNS